MPEGISVAPEIRFPDTADGARRVAGAVITDGRGRVFVQRRSPDRRLFPGCWDLVGGHVEPGESMPGALAREIAEETGWRLTAVVAELDHLVWTPDDGVRRHESDYLVRVAGDLSAPRLEPGKHTEFRWVGEQDLGLLHDSGNPEDTFVADMAARGLARAASL
ncbi:NUDIX hydrolase [Streptomonospora salina]|uniref:8-oxo-dGTP pyrophosphatase MutT (NUDIX family) n=1 Tax=Streptomonospora salina TaxID=104205 RepID=A0A841E972_9ACTN|nr:NUDIX domain-containing protein [Streptomonospora salina]MBB5997859.1 8-oxo-dGTP pyrophosphatase MutT (NUDIX family) [Streptomonospora salina]